MKATTTSEEKTVTMITDIPMATSMPMTMVVTIRMRTMKSTNMMKRMARLLWR